MTIGINVKQYGLGLLINQPQMTLVNFVIFQRNVRFLQLLNFQKLSYFCSLCNCVISSIGVDFVLTNSFESTAFIINIDEFVVCEDCGSSVKPEFKNQPICIFVEIFDLNSSDELFQLDDIPLSLSICDKTFIFLSCSVFDDTREHFTAIFRINESFFIVDNLKNTAMKAKNDFYKIKTIFYYLK